MPVSESRFKPHWMKKIPKNETIVIVRRIKPFGSGDVRYSKTVGNWKVLFT